MKIQTTTAILTTLALLATPARAQVTTTYSYDANGNMVNLTDARGNTTSYAYDNKDRLVSSTDSLNLTTTLSYDLDDRLTNLTDPKGQATNYTYDASDRLTQINFADGVNYNYTYDAASQLTNVSDSNGTWGYNYDDLGRVVQTTSPTGTVNYGYNANSLITQMTATGYGSVTYAYDNLDRLTGITKDGKTYGYEYDALGRRTNLTRPNGVNTAYAYDDANRLTSIFHQKDTEVLGAHEYEYDPNGNIVNYVRSEGKMATGYTKERKCKYVYKRTRRGKRKVKVCGWKKVPTGDIAYRANSGTKLTYNYEYDELNRLTKTEATGIVESASNFKSNNHKKIAYKLMRNVERVRNPRSKQVLLKKIEALGAVFPESASWQFDENGNIIAKTIHDIDGDVTRTYEYNENDWLISLTEPEDNNEQDHPPGWCHIHKRWHYYYHYKKKRRGGHGHGHGNGNNQPTLETITFNYDNNGNMTGDSAGRSFTWDAQDQLTSLTVDTDTSNFEYDPLGRRTNFDNKTYLYDGLSILTDSQSQFLHGAGIDEPLEINGSTNASYLQDHLGSTTKLIDSTNGTEETEYNYNAYGLLE